MVTLADGAHSLALMALVEFEKTAKATLTLLDDVRATGEREDGASLRGVIASAVEASVVLAQINVHDWSAGCL